MPNFSQSSLNKLSTCDERLQLICKEVIKIFDFTILVGHRNEAEQNEAFTKGFSKLRWPNGKHNSLPSKAIDIAPYPTDWNDHVMFYLLAGLMIGTAERMGIKLRWGGMWDGLQGGKSKFADLGHFEILGD